VGKNKLQRFAENLTFENFFQYTYEDLQSQGFPLKDRWHSDFFRNNNPIVIELGCGKGEYTVGLGEAYPGKNHIGIDIKGARMWRGLTTSNEKQLANIAFIRTRIELICNFFDKDEVSEIWITFPDPQPQSSRERKRLTAPRFLKTYQKFLKPGGIIHLKTDSLLLYEYTLETIKQLQHHIHYHTPDLYNSEEELLVKSIRTFYEQMWLDQGLSIKYIQFSLNSNG
jgi:tRNA (guanine-N7-)-methyltransferase